MKEEIQMQVPYQLRRASENIKQNKGDICETLFQTRMVEDTGITQKKIASNEIRKAECIQQIKVASNEIKKVEDMKLSKGCQ